MPLTDIAVRTAKPKAKIWRLFDDGGMYLEIAPSGGKYWRLKYRFEGKENRISLGTYPLVSLKAARDRRDEQKKLLLNGIDPSINRKAAKATSLAAGKESFELIAREWFSKNKPTWSASHSSRIIARLERDAFPWIGSKGVTELLPKEILAVIQRVDERGARETAHRLHQNIGQVFRYAIATGRALHDPAAPLRGAIPQSVERHHPSITDPKKIGALLRAIRGYEGQSVTQLALSFAPLVFVRPGELRKAEWAEFDFENAEWRIPASRMKMKTPHIVPLALQSISILQSLKVITGQSKYLFPGARTNGRPMSENTVNAALRRLGYSSDEMTGHGFRSMASTRLHEMGFNADAIERQLAHAERNNVKAAYNYAQYLPERTTMMQKWADYLDDLHG